MIPLQKESTELDICSLNYIKKKLKLTYLNLNILKYLESQILLYHCIRHIFRNP
jgi:hypothetical protein